MLAELLTVDERSLDYRAAADGIVILLSSGSLLLKRKPALKPGHLSPVDNIYKSNHIDVIFFNKYSWDICPGINKNFKHVSIPF